MKVIERYEQARENAEQKIKLAEYIVNITYPFVKDSKLFLSAIENTFLAYSSAISALLYYERLYKSIPPFHDTFESKFNMFKHTCVLKHRLNKQYILDIQDLKEIIVEHKKSPVEFTRKDAFVICGEHFKMRAIGVKEIKNYIEKAKLFIQEIDNIIEKKDIMNSNNITEQNGRVSN